MQVALAQFKLNLDRARDLIGLAAALEATTTSAIDVTDLWRAALVLAVSALDHYVHEVTRKGMLEISDGKRVPTDAYFRFQVSLRRIVTLRQTSGNAWLSQEIIDRHGWLSFQDPDKIADALRHITNQKVWNEIASHLKLSTSDAKARLRLIVERRNKIAHEADMDPTAPGMRWPIDAAIASDAIAFVSDLADILAKVVG
jgi:RiboL-PSP-HEPN